MVTKHDFKILFFCFVNSWSGLFYLTHFFYFENKIFLEVKTIKDLLINEQITEKQLRLNYEGGTHGIVTLQEAILKAEEAKLDLVLIAPLAEPPVAKIMDYGKYKFELLRREKDAKKKQKVTEIKGMQLSLNIADNDLSFKAKNVRKFLLSGDKVKVSLRMFGRQLANPAQGFPIMEKFVTLVEDVAEVTSKPVINGKQIVMILSPKTSNK
jgi:translation initiation factor IF-3